MNRATSTLGNAMLKSNFSVLTNMFNRLKIMASASTSSPPVGLTSASDRDRVLIRRVDEVNLVPGEALDVARLPFE